MLNDIKLDPDSVVFWGCMFGAFVMMAVNMTH